MAQVSHLPDIRVKEASREAALKGKSFLAPEVRGWRARPDGLEETRCRAKSAAARPARPR